MRRKEQSKVNSILEHVSAVAIWGSLAASFVLFSLMVYQSVIDTERRWRFATLAAVALSAAMLDLSFPLLSPLDYEFYRSIVWAAYGASVGYLFGESAKRSLSIFFLTLAIGAVVWIGISPNLATSFILPISFSFAAWVHYQQFRRSSGYASLLLAVASSAQAFMCALFYPVVSLGNPLFFSLGYFHYALITILATVEGWVQIPREIRGKVPVKVDRAMAKIFAVAFLSSELLVLPSLFIYDHVGIVLYVFGTLLQVGGYFFLFFRQRHNLIIFTDNVSALLSERTASLEQARENLHDQNLKQADLLNAQAKALKEKSEIIERQRRLELAAQTTGQAAHDIQNLITPIAHHLQMLEHNAGNPSIAKNIVGKVKTQIDELFELNGQLLALSRRGRSESVPVAIPELLSSVEERFHGNVSLSIKDSIAVMGSWAQISRAISNLIQNSIDAAPNSKVSVTCYREVTFQPKSCHLGFLTPGTYAAISISDEGPGISSDIIDKIFEPFFSQKSTRGKSGTGLGLSIVAAVLDDHRGIIDLTTSENGTTFTLYIPEAVDAFIEQPLEGTETILILDDDPEIHQTLGTAYQKRGYTVLSAYDGREALRMLQLTPVHAAVLDMRVPHISGLEVLVAFLHINPSLVSVIYSSYVTRSEENEAYAYGATSVFSKPSEPDVILRSLREALNRTTRRSAAA